MNTTIRNIINIAVILVLLIAAAPGKSLAYGQTESLDSTDNVENDESMNSNKDATNYSQSSYLNALKSAEQAEVENAIFDIIVLKLQHPDLEVEELHSELKTLALNSSSRSIRYKAYIAVNFLSDAQWVKNHRNEISVLTENEKYKFFQILADQFRQGYLTTANELDQ